MKKLLFKVMRFRRTAWEESTLRVTAPRKI
jgi:hypothetical protein